MASRLADRCALMPVSLPFDVPFQLANLICSWRRVPPSASGCSPPLADEWTLSSLPGAALSAALQRCGRCATGVVEQWESCCGVSGDRWRHQNPKRSRIWAFSGAAARGVALASRGGFPRWIAAVSEGECWPRRGGQSLTLTLRAGPRFERCGRAGACCSGGRQRHGCTRLNTLSAVVYGRRSARLLAGLRRSGAG